MCRFHGWDARVQVWVLIKKYNGVKRLKNIQVHAEDAYEYEILTTLWAMVCNYVPSVHTHTVTVN